MSINSLVLKKLIEKSGLVEKSDLNVAWKVSMHLGCSVTDVLLGRGLLKDEDLGKILEKHLKIKFADLAKIDIAKDVIKIIPEELSASRGVVSFEKHGKNLSVALEDPKDLELIEIVKKAVGSSYRVIPHIATRAGIKSALKGYRQTSGKEKLIATSDLQKLPAVNLIEKLLDDAIREEASDIHMEPLAERFLIRFRVDGVLHDKVLLSKDIHASVIARIKILSGLKLDEQRLPQDGQFSYISIRGEKISLRVSVIPTVFGEKIVLRILESSLAMFNLQELGLLEEDQGVVGAMLEKTHGMILFTGPTGSGKTTSLYTILGLLNRPGVNIITIEDPVENKINRVNQIQVNQKIKLTFASGLRAVLRQDPDIVMVGEIRDRETAVIATNAAMTGHLVFSTVHANTSSAAIPRMIDLGAEPYLLASTLVMVIAQRLVRVLCPKCKEEIEIDPLIRQKLEESKSKIAPEIIKSLKKNYLPKGCPACYFTGFHGRIGIFEILVVTDEIKNSIVNKVPSNKIWEQARKYGSKTMLEDGLIKVAKGITTTEEVFRVISE